MKTKTLNQYSKTTFALLILILFLSFKVNPLFYKIDKSIIKELEINRKINAEMNGQLAYFGFLNKSEYTDSFNKYKQLMSNSILLYDTFPYLTTAVCGCKVNKDTITIFGGIFYAGGIGYSINIYKDSFESSIIISSSKKYKTSLNSELTDELDLASKSQELFLTKAPTYNLNDNIKGKILMESDKLWVLKDGKMVEETYWMKVVFDCTLKKSLGF